VKEDKEEKLATMYMHWSAILASLGL